ncbi:cation-translocating P-type ATPase [Halolamina litorea]|uniref:Cation-translocating P-type ATPase n=1 Tax=Halolamina litorea TaxID=1515593 RepID=A0ABD6BV18_9EURY|nr:cation-translocating P-type ATPase [Halolamina litorea]
MDWFERPVEAVLDELGTTPAGLDAETARERRREFGPNEITGEEARSPVRILLSQFTSALIWVLIAAAALSVVVGHVVDAALIGTILLVNGVFGFLQEYRAERSLDALRDMATPTVTVRRDGAEREIEATALVPGDVIRLEQGAVVPADARLIEAGSLEVDESALTGESAPVGKTVEPVSPGTPLAERSNMVYKGTNVSRGSGLAAVVATGMGTEVGSIATALLGAEDRRTPLQRDLDRLGRRLGVAVVVLSAMVVPLLWLGGEGPVLAALTAVSLAVAAVPEGLPAVVTLTLALGVRRMAAENALVRTLPAVEALGAVDVVCTDKTGTLTEGEMRVQRLWVDDETVAVDGDAGDDATDERVDRLLEIGALCNDATADDGDPTERALVAAAEHRHDVEKLRERRPRRDAVAFSAERKRMATIHDDVIYVKGAPEEVLSRSTRLLGPDGAVPLDHDARERVHRQVSSFAEDALRVLAFAFKRPSDDSDPEENLVFVGLQGLIDPPRAEVEEAIAETRRAGIGVKVITGDNATTGRAVAAQVGVDSAVLTGAEIDAMDDETLRERVESVDVYARAEPAHKVRILTALQANGHTVAMTGDGVNDAPALKNADVGIAMGVRGTDVAKQASDIVLLDDNYATIRTAIKRGRTVFDNVWKFVAYLLSANVAEVAVVFVASLFGYLVLPAVQLLWINLLTDGLPALALGTDPSGDVMDRRPRERVRGIVDRPMGTLIAGAGLTATVLMLGLLFGLLDGAPAVTPYVMTMVFTGFVGLEFVKLYVVRWTRGTPMASNRWLAVAVATSSLLHLAVLYTPIGAYFGTVPLTAADWTVLAGVLLAGAPALFLVGWLVRRRTVSPAGRR